MINEKVIEILKYLWRFQAIVFRNEHLDFSKKEIREALEKGIEVLENQKSVIEELEYLKADIRFHGFYNERIEDLIDEHIAVLKGEQ